MNIENMKQSWQESFNKCVEEIEGYLAKPRYEDRESYEFQQLAKWLLENPYNAYEYMPSGYEKYRSNPFETESLLAQLHHAICDDGEVSFVKMVIDGEIKRVFMVFTWTNEDNFIPLCEKENQSYIDTVISSRQRMNEFKLKMKEKNPLQEVNVRKNITREDVVFQAHNDPLIFIQEVEDLQLSMKKHEQEFEEKMKTMKSRKM